MIPEAELLMSLLETAMAVSPFGTAGASVALSAPPGPRTPGHDYGIEVHGARVDTRRCTPRHTPRHSPPRPTNDNSRMQPIVTERPGVEEEPGDADPPSPDSGDLASRIATVKLPSSRYRPPASRRCLTLRPFQPGCGRGWVAAACLP
jgi:hypothetical protein